MDPKKAKVLQAQLNARQVRDLQLARELKEIPRESRATFVLRELQKEPVTRTFSIEAREFDDESQSFDFAFSSEHPVERWFGREILVHTPEAANLDRLNDGGAFCVSHDTWSGQVGVHEKAWLDAVEKRCRGRARMSRNNPRAVQEYLDIKDGIRRHISVQYQIHDLTIVQHDDQPDEYFVTRWTALENSTVAVPADHTVGVGRGLFDMEEPAIEPEKEQGRMDPKDKNNGGQVTANDTPDVDVIRAEGRSEGEAAGLKAGEKAAMERVNEMLAVGEKFDNPQMAREFIEAGKSYRELVDACLDARSSEAPPTDVELGMSERDAAKFSFCRLIDAEGIGNATARKAAAFEYDVIASTADKVRSSEDSHGLPIPLDVMRAQLVSDGPTGGLLTNHGQQASMIEELVNATKFLELGAQPFGDLVGTFDVPVDKGGVAAHVVGEDEAPEVSEALFGLKGVSPKTVAASAYYPRSWAKQTSLDIEIFLRRKLMQAHGQKKDILIAQGLGGRHQPVGVFNTPEIPIVEIDTNGGALTRDHLVMMETLPDVANALAGALAFLTNAKVKGQLRRTPEHETANVGGWVWEKSGGGNPTVGDLLGYAAHVSNAIPSNLVKGNSGEVCSAALYGDFSQIALCSWGSLEIMIDPYSSSSKGGTFIHTFSDFDALVMRAASFAMVKDIVTG